MAKPIYDPDGHLRNYCIVSRAVCEIFPNAVSCEIHQYTTPFELSLLIGKECISGVSLTEDQMQALSCGQTVDLPLSMLCHILRWFQNSQVREKYFFTVSSVSPKELNEIQTLLKELYVFENTRMLPKKEFRKLWNKVKYLCLKFDKHCLPRLISYSKQCKAIKKKYTYGQEEHICSLMAKQWCGEREFLRKEVVKLRSLYKEYTKGRKVFPVRNVLKKMINSLRGRDSKIEHPSDYQYEEKGFNKAECLDDELGSHNLNNQPCDVNYGFESLERANLEQKKLKPSFSSLDNQAITEEGDDFDKDAPPQFNALLGDGSSILEMDVTDTHQDSTMVKNTWNNNVQEECLSFLQDRMKNLPRVQFLDTDKETTAIRYEVEEGGNFLSSTDSKMGTAPISNSRNGGNDNQTPSCTEELESTNKFESKHEFRIETHCPGPPDKKVDDIEKENKRRFSTPHSSMWHSPLMTEFVSRSVFDSHLTELGSSFLQSSIMAEASSYWRDPPSIHKCHFGDLGCKSDVMYVEKINSMTLLSYLEKSEGIVSTLYSGNSSESVLTLNCNLLSSSVVRENNKAVMQVSNNQLLPALLKTNYCVHVKTQFVNSPCMFFETVCGFSKYDFVQKIPIKLCEKSQIVLHEMRSASDDFRRTIKFLLEEMTIRANNDFGRTITSLLERILFCYNVKDQKKHMIECSPTGAVNCSESHSFSSSPSLLCMMHDEETISIKIDSSEKQVFCLGNETLPSYDMEVRQKYTMKREKEQLKRRVVKRMYSALWAEKVSKKRFHQAIRRASIQCLMAKFFRNFNTIVKKDDNEVSKIINHYFNLLSFNTQRSSFPVGRGTPSRLEAFLQEIIENEEATAADTMHVEWMRLRTFWSYPTNTGVSTLQLARDGFFYTGHTTETRCFCCRNVYREWDETSNINEIHRRISPNCDIAFGRPTRNISIHDNQGGINLASSNVDSLAQEQYQTRRQDEASEQNTGQTSNSETEQAEAAQISKGDEQQSAQSPKLSKSKIKLDKRKKKKELASSSQLPAAGLAISEVPQTTQTTASSSATGSQATGTDVASNASTNATGSASAAARSIPEKAKEPLAVGGFQIEDVQHHSASIPSEISQQELNSFPSSASDLPSISQSETSELSQSQTSGLSQSQTSGLSQSQTSTQPQRSAGANPPGPAQGGANPTRPPHVGANPPGPPQSGANPPAPTSAERLAQLDPLGINFDKPKYPAYAVYSTRLSSFDGWPSHMAQTPREMARAGYFYAGYGDYARCFFCGGGLRNWDRTDEPWMEHARWFPRCAFLRNNKGDKYVARVQRRHQEQEAGLEPSSQLPPPIERDMETAIAQALREMGFTNQIIQRAMNKWRLNLKPGRRHPPPMTAAGILDIIEEIQREEEDQAHTQPVTEERPLTIPGIQDLQIADGSSQASVQNISDGASALEENRTDFDPGDGQPREYGYDQREKQEKQVLQEDFLGLTETIVCKVCCDKDVAAAFLPCGHLVCCLDCAPAMRRCPLCGELIKGTVKTYFA